MCGISGIFTVGTEAGQRVFGAAAIRMASLMQRRGPDDQGSWTDPQGHLQLGFRRLSILDRSLAGHQPMVSHDDRSVIAFNGEIYNFRELRRELEQTGIQFRSRSDTEVLLEALNHWGTDAIPRLNGMFAFAWYDREARTLVLARDHAGVKPLYFFVDPAGRGVAFASQYNALLHTPWGSPGTVRTDVLRLFLRLHHIPPPFGLLDHTFQLEPGHYAEFNVDGRLKNHAWWSLPEDPEPNLKGPEAVEALAEVMGEAVRRQRIADVPVGVFLSGGIDSPLVTAIASTQTGPGLKAFTIGNPGWGQDESDAAERYAAHLQVDHHLEPVDSQDGLAVIEDVIAAQHEPFADFSILPTLLVSRLARQQVTVALSGDGGDEIFFGYERPRSLMRGGRDFRFPWLVRLALYAAGLYGLGPSRSDTVAYRTPGEYYLDVNSRLKDDQLAQLAPGLQSLPDAFDLYRFPGYKGERHLANYARRAEFYGQLQRGLKKVDMASMHCSLEVRVPLLDREVVDLGLRIDPFASLRDGQRKAVLRDLLGRYVPPNIIPTAKLGFAVPLGRWMKSGMRDLVEHTLFDGELYPEGIFDRKAVRRYWQDHLDGRVNGKWGLWTLLSLQWWARHHLNQNVIPADHYTPEELISKK